MTSTTAAEELAAARRRIRQLETALMRRGEALEQKQAALQAIYASTAWKLVRHAFRLRDRVLPPHSRRRNFVKAAARLAASAARLLAGVRRREPGATGDGFGQTPDPGTYRRWLKKHEPGRAELRRQRSHRFGRSPLVSVVVPVYNTPPAFLDAMIYSVLDQSYPRWQLCLADASSAEHVGPILEKHAAADGRIVVRRLERNLGIAGNTNAALDMADGDYVALLDHDDTLAPFALHEIAAAVNDDPEVDLLYSDEDKLDAGGRRVEPSFKPAWSPETLRSRNYVCHLTVMRRELIQEIGGFREGFDGAQDHDLVLRAGERAKRVRHIPKVLYHWRMHEQSTAARKASKNYAYDAGKRAVADHLDRLGIPATVRDGATLGVYHVIYRLPTQPLVSVIVPNKDQAGLLSRCVESLKDSSYANYELLIVENGSVEDETFRFYAEVEREPHVRVLKWGLPFNYAAVNNFAANQAAGDLLLFLNNDIEAINPDWLEEMVKLATQPGVGAVGAKLYYADDTIQHAGIVLGMGGVAGHGHLGLPREAPGYAQQLLVTQNVAAVTGACLMTPAGVFREVGGFDEGFVLAFNDVDLCVQIGQHGYRVVWTPAAELYHYESKTRGYEDTPEKQARFKREIDLFQAKWGEVLAAGDPYYSPHFRLDRSDYCLRT